MKMTVAFLALLNKEKCKAKFLFHSFTFHIMY